MTWTEIGTVVAIIALVATVLILPLNYITTGDPFKFYTNIANSACGEGIHVTHLDLISKISEPIANLAIKQMGSGTYTFGATNQTGYLILSICAPIGAIVTFQATDYAFQLEPHHIV